MSISRFQGIITALATAASVDIRFPGARVVYAQTGYGRLCIEALAANQVMVVQRWDDAEDTIESPCIILHTGAPAWTPMRLSSRSGSINVAEVDDRGRVVVTFRDGAVESLEALCEEWSECLIAGGWFTDAECVCRDRGDEDDIEEAVRGALSALNITVERT
jgi:hypothetical protein